MLFSYYRNSARSYNRDSIYQEVIDPVKKHYKRRHSATDSPTPQANESEPGNAKTNPCPNGSGCVPDYSF